MISYNTYYNRNNNARFRILVVYNIIDFLQHTGRILLFFRSAAAAARAGAHTHARIHEIPFQETQNCFFVRRRHLFCQHTQNEQNVCRI